ncbi:MAG TPA: maleylacetoacetate isomerase [Beijerinckiaceae bacterium]|nr:maleylacetoacetate isomerase [Beijerinckiaceae bacterium]
MKLYTFFRSSAAYRVRIAMNLKGLSYDAAFVSLPKNEQRHADYMRINPQGRVPTLDLDGAILIQSPAILEYLEEAHPEPPLLPRDPVARAKIRAVAAVIGCDIHPLNNSGTLAYLKTRMGQDEAAANAWYAHWVVEGFRAIEQLIEPGPFAFGDKPSLADIYLAPQVYNARRFTVPLDDFPKIVAVDAAGARLEAFRAAAPERQPDAV